MAKTLEELKAESAELFLQEKALQAQSEAIKDARAELRKAERAETRRLANIKFVEEVAGLEYDWHSDLDRSHDVLGVSFTASNALFTMSEWAIEQQSNTLSKDDAIALAAAINKVYGIN